MINSVTFKAGISPVAQMVGTTDEVLPEFRDRFGEKLSPARTRKLLRLMEISLPMSEKEKESVMTVLERGMIKEAYSLTSLKRFPAGYFDRNPHVKGITGSLRPHKKGGWW